MLQASSSEDEDQIVGQEDVSDGHHPPTVYRHSRSDSRHSNQHHTQAHPVPNRDSTGSGQGGHRGSTRSNNSGSSGSPASTSRAPSFENPKHYNNTSLDTESINSGLSVPSASYDSTSLHNTPRHERHPHIGGNHSRSNSIRSTDRSPQPIRRAVSPTVSVISDREREDLERLDLEAKRRHLQIYVFVLRCIAFPFNAKQKPPQHDMQKRQAKVSKQELTKIKDRFLAFLQGETSIMADEAFKNAVQSYYEVFLKSDRVSSLVRSGASSSNDFREVFKNNIEKRVRSLPEIDGLSKETVLCSWMTKFDTIYRGDDSDRRLQRPSTAANELILSQDQLYEMFQNIFNVQKYEHLILYNALQLDNPDEQAAQVRRELASRQQQIDSGAFRMKPWKPRFVVKEMDHMYVEELNAQVLQLKANLESVPVKGGNLQKHPRKIRPTNPLAKIDVVDENEQSLSRLDVVLSFTIEVVIVELKGLKLPPNKNIYCTMELDGVKLQTGLTTASKPSWVTQGDFSTTQPLPHVKIKLCMENVGVLPLDDKELGKITLKPNATSPKSPQIYKLLTPKTIQEELNLKVTIRMDKPQNMKYCGYLYALGKKQWRTCKSRYFVLVQVSQYTFAICSYKEKQAEPTEMLQLKGFTVDYCERQPEMECRGSMHYFKAVKEGDSVTLATKDENERHNWVQALYRATGQSHKPTPPVITANSNGTNGTNAPNHPIVSKLQGDIDPARKHGLDDYVSADPCEFNHAELFQCLQTLTLEYRMNDAFTCLGWLSPGQNFILDEYVSRYCVRGCHRYLCYMSDLLEKAENGLMIDPNIIHYSFAFCAAHVHGNKPDGLGTITSAEKAKFDEIRSRLRALLEHQITYFRYCFPFGRPDGALKSTLSLLEKVLMKELTTQMSVDEVRSVIKKCLEEAALVNYTRISEFAKIEEGQENPAERLDDITHLASLCIEVLQQNEEHHAEAFTWFADVLQEHNEMFWSLFAVDMDACLEVQPHDNWDSFNLFTLLNVYLLTDKYLKHGKFHNHLREIFAPQCVRYVDMMETSIGQSIDRGFTKEKWEAHGSGCATSEEMLWKIDALQTFIKELLWPEEVFAEHLEHRLKLMASDMIEAAGNRTVQAFDVMMGKISKSIDFIIPSEMCVMINTLSDCKLQAFKLCIMSGDSTHQYHIIIEEFLDGVLKHIMESLIDRLTLILQNTCGKLARYDEGSLLKSLLSLTKPTDEYGKEYVMFVSGNLDMIRQKTIDEIIVNTIFELWYSRQISIINTWLAERMQMALHPYQLTCLIHIIRKLYSDFELQGVPHEKLASSAYETICKRLSVEETTHSVNECRNSRPITGLSIDHSS